MAPALSALPFEDAIRALVEYKEHWAASQETWVLITAQALTLCGTLVSPFQSLGLNFPIFEKGEVDVVPSCSGRFEVTLSFSFSLSWPTCRQEVAQR